MDEDNDDNKGSEWYVVIADRHAVYTGLGEWYLPYLDPATHHSPSSYLNCSGYHTAVSHSQDIQDTYLVFFQWMPDKGWKGRVVFRGMVIRGDKEEWENIKEVVIEVVSSLKISDGKIKQSTKREETTRTYFPITQDDLPDGYSIEDVEMEEETILPEENDNNKANSDNLTTQMSPYFVPHSGKIVENISVPMSDIFLYTISGYHNISDILLQNISNYDNITDLGAESYQRLEAEYGGWGEGGVGSLQFSSPLYLLFFLHQNFHF